MSVFDGAGGSSTRLASYPNRHFGVYSAQHWVADAADIDEGQLRALQTHEAQLTKNLQALVNVDTAAAMAFRNQLLADQIVLQVDIQDMQFRLTLLRQYLIDNF